MIFKNGRLIFPNGVREGLDLLVEDGLITAIRGQAPVMGEQAVDLQGNYLAPGFIDLHIHGAMGHDAMEASAKAFRAICTGTDMGTETICAPTSLLSFQPKPLAVP